MIGENKSEGICSCFPGGKEPGGRGRMKGEDERLFPLCGG